MKIKRMKRKMRETVKSAERFVGSNRSFAEPFLGNTAPGVEKAVPSMGCAVRFPSLVVSCGVDLSAVSSHLPPKKNKNKFECVILEKTMSCSGTQNDSSVGESNLTLGCDGGI